MACSGFVENSKKHCLKRNNSYHDVGFSSYDDSMYGVGCDLQVRTSTMNYQVLRMIYSGDDVIHDMMAVMLLVYCTNTGRIY